MFKVTVTNYTIADYCEQFQKGNIIVNNAYQRSNQVWPVSAKSYLIDTILQGYPIPKLSLFQKTDLVSRKSIKEIVDGQQRTHAIVDFYNDKLKLTSSSANWRGNSYATLPSDIQQRFLEYDLNVNLFVGATQPQIREMFRRINSYNIPLNKQELRHATYQGEFKWFINRLSNKYAQKLIDFGVFKEKNISRMDDASLITQTVRALTEGINHKSEKALDNIYKSNEVTIFEQSPLSAQSIENHLDQAIDQIDAWPSIHKSNLMKSYNFYSLTLAIIHLKNNIPSLQNIYNVANKTLQPDNYIEPNLTALDSAQNGELTITIQNIDDYLDACSRATTRKTPREKRLVWFCRALSETNL